MAVTVGFHFIRQWSGYISLRLFRGQISFPASAYGRCVTEKFTCGQFSRAANFMHGQSSGHPGWSRQAVQACLMCSGRSVPKKYFHTSQRRPIHPLIWVLIKPFAKLTAALTGRGVRQWFRRLGPAERQQVMASIKRRWYIPAGIGATLVGSGVVYYTSHIQETPLTGRQRFVALTHDQIKQISQAEAESLIEAFQDKLLPEKDVRSQRVLHVAHRLLAANPELRKMQFKEWQIFVIDSPLVNACVLPSGQMFVFDGILQVANTPDQLAVILGHEMAHAVLEHGVEELSLGKFLDIIVIFSLAAIWCIMPFDGIAIVSHWFYEKVMKLLMHMPHSRLLEKEADEVGLLFAAKACFDVREGSLLWTKMSHQEKLTDTEGTLQLPEWMTTHPDSLKRAEHLDFLYPRAEKWREEMNCPRLPANDPRQAIKILSQHLDNKILATKTGQDLRQVKTAPKVLVKSS